jgi:predicted  nucleic acid-binding Zn-ribbon protein
MARDERAAHMSRWETLLSVQDHDTHIDQAVHRRSALPARGELTAVMERIGAIEKERADIEARHHDLSRDQQRLEDEITTLNDKAAQHDKALYSGSITNPRELQAMQDEIAALKRRIGQLEDQELELMEQIEPLDADLSRLAQEREAADASATALRAGIAEDEVAIDAELDRLRAARATESAAIEAELLSEYETLRSQNGGIGIARLVGGSCGGCHLGLSAVEVDRLKKLPPDAPAHCEECGRLLAR